MHETRYDRGDDAPEAPQVERVVVALHVDEQLGTFEVPVRGGTREHVSGCVRGGVHSQRQSV